MDLVDDINECYGDYIQAYDLDSPAREGLNVLVLKTGMSSGHLG